MSSSDDEDDATITIPLVAVVPVVVITAGLYALRWKKCKAARPPPSFMRLLQPPSALSEFALEDFSLGMGRNIVKRARRRSNGEGVAVKLIVMNDWKEVLTEWNISEAIHTSPMISDAKEHFIRIESLIHDVQRDRIWLVLPLALGDLYTHVIRRREANPLLGNLEEFSTLWKAGENSPRIKAVVDHMNELLGFFKSLAHALFALHGQNILHQDIKPDNILVFQTERGLDVKFADFGFSCVQLNPRQGCGMRVGTASYLDPLVRQRHYVTFSSDVYSLGVTFLEAFMVNRLDASSLTPEFLAGVRNLGIFHPKLLHILRGMTDPTQHRITLGILIGAKYLRNVELNTAMNERTRGGVIELF